MTPDDICDSLAGSSMYLESDCEHLYVSECSKIGRGIDTLKGFAFKAKRLTKETRRSGLLV